MALCGLEMKVKTPAPGGKFHRKSPPYGACIRAGVSQRKPKTRRKSEQQLEEKTAFIKKKNKKKKKRKQFN